MEQIPAKDSEPESIVRQYFELAYSGQYDEIKKLTMVKPIPQPTLSKRERRKGMNDPISKAFEELDREEIEKGVPELIYIGKYRVVKINPLLKDRNEAKFLVALRSENSRERPRPLLFKLFRVNSDWKIYLVTYKEIDDAMNELLIEGEPVEPTIYF